MLGSYSLLKICFLCLSDDDEDLLNVFSEDEDNILVINKIEYLISPDLLMLEPENPESICSSCLRKLNSFYEFKQSCLENGRRLRNFINGAKTSENENDLMVSEETLASTAECIGNKYEFSSNLLVPKEEIESFTENIDNNSEENSTEFCEQNSDDCNEDHIDINEEISLENEDEESDNNFVLIISEDEDSVILVADTNCDEFESSNHLILKEEIEDVTENRARNAEEGMEFCEQNREDNNEVHVATSKKSNRFSEDQDNCMDIDVQEIDDIDKHSIKEEFADDSNICNEKLVPTENETTDTNICKPNQTNVIPNTSKEEINTRVYCAKCGKSYKSKKYLIHHIRSLHNTSKQKFECTICNITFKHQYSEARHNKLHSVNKKEKFAVLPNANDSNVYNKVLEPTENETSDTNNSESDQNNVIQNTTKEEINKKGSCKKKINLINITSHQNTPNQKFECTICNVTFKYKYSETRHKEQHELKRLNIKKFNCTECETGYSKKESLIRHMRCHPEDKLFKCSVCGKICLSEHVLLKHQRRKHNDLEKLRNKVSDKSFQKEPLVLKQEKNPCDVKEVQEYKCNTCSKSFSKKHLLLKHEKTHTDLKDIQEHNVSDKSFQKKRLLLTQDKTHDDVKDLQEFNNKVSDKSLQKEPLVLKQEKNPCDVKEVQEYKCNTCYKSFSKKHLLLKHEKTHTDLKDIQEHNVSDKSFQIKRLLLTQDKTHDDVKDLQEFKNKVSDKSLQKEPLVLKQEKNPYNVKEVQEYKCNTCDKSFSKKHLLLKHEKTHTDLKDIQEHNVSDKSFQKKRLLLKQDRTHDDVKDLQEFKNKVSDKSLQKEPLVLKQEKNPYDVKEVQEYKCNTCDKSFSKKHLLLKHEKTHTDLKDVQEHNVSDKSFQKKRLLLKQDRTHDDAKDLQKFMCLTCDEKFLTKQLLLKHKKTHNHIKDLQKLKCNICHKSFKMKDALLNHKKNHDKAFPCKFCKKKFRRGCALSIHMKYLHYKEKKNKQKK